MTTKAKNELVYLWHKRLGHPNFSYLKKLMPNIFLNIDVKDLFCDVCNLTKLTKSVYPPKPYVPSHAFNLVHSDIWGPFQVANINGAKWFITFVDDHTRITWVYLIKHKSEVGKIVRTFVNLIKNQFNTTIKTLRTDNGVEYFDSTVNEFFIDNGIHHQTSCVYTPQQNGVAERKNRHLLKVARTIMFTMHVPGTYWGEAVLTATYLINRMPSRVINFLTPRQKLLELFPTTHLISELPLKTFGCVAYVLIPSHQRGKLDRRSHRCIFLGYSGTQKGYKCYCPITRKVFVALDIHFDEQHSYYLPKDTSDLTHNKYNDYWNIIQIDTVGETGRISLPEN